MSETHLCETNKKKRNCLSCGNLADVHIQKNTQVPVLTFGFLSSSENSEH